MRWLCFSPNGNVSNNQGLHSWVGRPTLRAQLRLLHKFEERGECPATSATVKAHGKIACLFRRNPLGKCHTLIKDWRRNMKPQILSCLWALGFSISAHAATFTYSVGATIPDGNLSGLQSSQSISGLSSPITDLNVTLEISGGFNGDFYAFLTHDNTTAILLNRVGRNSSHQVGYPDAGVGPDAFANTFTFDDQAATDVHSYRNGAYSLNGNGQLTGSWQADGRLLDPLSPASAFDGAARSAMLSVFNGMDPNGTWTFYVADVSAGAEGTLATWGLQITTVPEPASATLLGIGLLMLITRRAQTRRPFSANIFRGSSP
jgi:subtilisin-like proprotein convertase family protein